jgi:(S)-ureidoglycine aminohydrolase
MLPDIRLKKSTPGVYVRSRQAVRRNYALLPPEGLMPSTIPSLTETTVNFLAAPALGASFVQFLAHIEPGGGRPDSPGEAGVQYFYYVLNGSIVLDVGNHGPQTLMPGCYAYIPPGAHYSIVNGGGHTARLLGLKKRYEAIGLDPPQAIISSRLSQQVVTRPGLAGRTWQYLLPVGDIRFDMEMNILSFGPGSFFENIETHVMEHGLYMLEGHGMYLLDTEWHETQAEDFIWMGPFCPQYFIPSSDTQASYLLYKNVNRDVPV